MIFGIKINGVLGENGVRRYDLNVVRVGQPYDKSTGSNSRSYGKFNVNNKCTINEFSLDYLVEEKRYAIIIVHIHQCY